MLRASRQLRVKVWQSAAVMSALERWREAVDARRGGDALNLRADQRLVSAAWRAWQPQASEEWRRSLLQPEPREGLISTVDALDRQVRRASMQVVDEAPGSAAEATSRWPSSPVRRASMLMVDGVLTVAAAAASLASPDRRATPALERRASLRVVDEAPTASAAADRRERIIDTIAASPPTAARPAASPPSGPSATFFVNHGGESPIFVEVEAPSLDADEPGDDDEDVASVEMVRLRDAWHVICLRLSREAHGRALVRRAARQHDVSVQRRAMQHWLSVQRLDLEERIAATIRDLAANELAAM